MDDYNNGKSGGGSEMGAWIGIIACMIVFWPLGIFMLLRHLGSYAKNKELFKPEQKVRFNDYNMTGQNQNNKSYAAQEQKKQNNKAYTAAEPAQVNKKKEKRSRLEKKSGKFVSTLLLLISIALIIGGVSRIIGPMSDIINYGIGDWSNLGMGIFHILGGLITLFARNTRVRRISRYRTYYLLLSGRGVTPISDISSASGLSEKTVRRDIQAMIDAGYLGTEAYIDNGLRAVVMTITAAEEARAAAYRAEEKPEAAREDKPVNRYMAIISELRALNVTIEDIPISDKIDRIEVLTAKIFRIVEENPAKLPQIRRFMNYYLPTTLKLLHSYATLEKQGIKGENITSAKQSISDILEKLSTGFEQQLDILFKDDAIDISADIDVLERMMKQDGLSEDGGAFQTMEGGV